MSVLHESDINIPKSSVTFTWKAPSSFDTRTLQGGDVKFWWVPVTPVVLDLLFHVTYCKYNYDFQQSGLLSCFKQKIITPSKVVHIISKVKFFAIY